MDVWGEGGCSKPSHFLSITYTSHSAPLLTVTPYCTNNYPTAPHCNSIAVIKKAAYLITSLLDLSSPTHLWDQSDELLTTPPGSLFRGFNHLPGGGRQQDSHTCISLIKGIIMIVHKALVLNKVWHTSILSSLSWRPSSMTSWNKQGIAHPMIVDTTVWASALSTCRQYHFTLCLCVCVCLCVSVCVCVCVCKWLCVWFSGM